MVIWYAWELFWHRSSLGTGLIRPEWRNPGKDVNNIQTSDIFASQKLFLREPRMQKKKKKGSWCRNGKQKSLPIWEKILQWPSKKKQRKKQRLENHSCFKQVFFFVLFLYVVIFPSYQFCQMTKRDLGTPELKRTNDLNKQNNFVSHKFIASV